MADRESPCGIIDITTPVNSGQTATVTSIISAFELVYVSVQGANGCTATVKKNGNIAAVANYATGAPVTQGCTITNANASFAAADTLTIEVATANATRITLFTRFPDAYADTLTVTVA